MNSNTRGILRSWLSAMILLAATLLGIWAFVYPFFTLPRQQAPSVMSRQADAPFTFVVLLALCLVVVIANLETRQMNSKMVAVLGILVAINSVLRLIPGPAGFSAMLFLPILCGYVYGADFGFLLGALSFLVSSIVTGGLGPWLPYQMLSAGWMGMASGWLRQMSRLGRFEIVLLGLWGALLGFIFGAVMNLWFWPYILDTGQSAMYWRPGASLSDLIARYATFYIVTSLWWDVGRAAGNLLLILLFGAPILQLLRRFQKRFDFVVE
jgi:energy-coupling factor transport system substrate-specific component